VPQSRTLSPSPMLSRALLAPRSIAIVGASADPSKVAARPLQYLRQAGYAGTIYPINARRDTVLGERAWPSLEALPEAPDHAFILAGADGVVEAVQECAARGVKVATILATGFAEAGHEGLQRVDALKKIVAETGIRILGPSSIGVVNFHAKALLTANAAFAESNLPSGGVFVASHSGSMLGALVSRGKARSVGFAGLVSVGNEIDLTLGEICAMTLDDPAVTGYMLFLESLRHADDLRRFAVAAAERGKPVVAYKLGRSQQGAELALSHTGALAGEDDIAGAFLSDCGIARVENFEALLETLPLLGRVPAGAVRGRVPEQRYLRALAERGRQRRTWRAGRSHHGRHAARRDEGRARCDAGGAGVRSDRRGHRIVGALPSRTRGKAGHRKCIDEQAAGFVPRARCTGCAGDVVASERSEFQNAGSLRRCDRCGVRTPRCGCTDQRFAFCQAQQISAVE